MASAMRNHPIDNRPDRVRCNAPALVGTGRRVAQMTHVNKIAVCSARALIFSHLVPFAVLYRGGTVGTR